MAATTAQPGLRLVADAAGRARFVSPRLRGHTAAAVAVEDAIDQVPGVRQVHAYPRTGSVVVWYDADTCRPAELEQAIDHGLATDPAATAGRLPRSPDARGGALA